MSLSEGQKNKVLPPWRLGWLYCLLVSTRYPVPSSAGLLESMSYVEFFSPVFDSKGLTEKVFGNQGLTGFFGGCSGLSGARSGVNRVKGKKPSPFSAAGGFFERLGGGELCPRVMVGEVGPSAGDGAESDPSKSELWGTRRMKSFERLSATS